MTTIISKEELKDQILDITLIDVRDNYSYKLSHIQSARNIPLESLEEEVQKKYKQEEKLVIYGEDEQMGEEAVLKLENVGYKHIQVYKEGFRDWRRAHMPVRKADLGNERRT